MQKPGLGEEGSPSGEKADIDKVTEIEVRLLQKAVKKPIPRSQHPKQHGCVWAEFTVEGDLPDELKVGLFKESGRKLPAWIRFSNARKQDDSKGGAHGMAIKLMGVEGEKELREEDAKTQDFVLFDHPVFFIRNVKDYLVFDESLEESLEKSPNAPKPIKFLFPSFNPLKWRLHEFFIVQALQSKRIDSPLETQYWSATAYKLGSLAVKYFVKPSNRVRTYAERESFFLNINLIR